MSFVPEGLELEVPEKIRGTFRRMLYRSPKKVREDPEYQVRLLTFLKLGNESAARQFIAIQKVHLIEQLSLIKRHARDVADSDTNETENLRSEAQSDEGLDTDGNGNSKDLM